MTEQMSNYIIGLADIREKLWTLEREKKESQFLLFYFLSSEISRRKV